jgi:4-hydroxy-3-polyprenylbenzoate decarboxylase
LAKYLWIVAAEDNPALDVRNVADFLRHALERVDWRRDLHFQTCTTLDTLDYSSGRLGEGSKLVIAAAGPPARALPTQIDSRLALPEELGFHRPRVVLPGILVVEGPAAIGEGFRVDSRLSLRESSAPFAERKATIADEAIARFCQRFDRHNAINEFPLIVVVDQSDFAAQTLDNFLWTTFTRSNPASDVYGIESFVAEKHWACLGSLVIDARAKSHHAPPLVEDPAVTHRVDALAAPGGPLHGVI